MYRKLQVDGVKKLQKALHLNALCYEAYVDLPLAVLEVIATASIPEDTSHLKDISPLLGTAGHYLQYGHNASPQLAAKVMSAIDSRLTKPATDRTFVAFFAMGLYCADPIFDRITRRASMVTSLDLLNFSHFKQSHLLALVKTTSLLRSLVVGHTHITDSEMVDLVMILNKYKLRVLKLVSITGLTQLSPLPSLKRVHLEKCNDLTYSSLFQLSRCLTEVTIANCNGFSSVAVTLNVMQLSPNVTSFEFSGKPVGVAQAKPPVPARQGKFFQYHKTDAESNAHSTSSQYNTQNTSNSNPSSYNNSSDNNSSNSNKNNMVVHEVTTEEQLQQLTSKAENKLVYFQTKS